MYRDSLTIPLPDALDTLLAEPFDFNGVATEIVQRYLEGEDNPATLNMALVLVRSALMRSLGNLQKGFISSFPAEIFSVGVNQETIRIDQAVLNYLVDTLKISYIEEPIDLPSGNASLEQHIVATNPNLNFGIKDNKQFTLAVVNTRVLNTDRLPHAYRELENGDTVISLYMLPGELTLPAPLPQAA